MYKDTSCIAVSMEAKTFESRNSGFPDEKKSIIAAKISGLRKSHEASSDFVTVTKSDPKKTLVTPKFSPIKKNVRILQ